MDYSLKVLEENIKIYNELMDEESKLLYRANLVRQLLGDEEFYKCVEEVDREKNFGYNDLMSCKYFQKNDSNNVREGECVLFGCGKNSIIFYYQLKALGYKVIGLCDNNKELIGKHHLGFKVTSPEDLLRDFGDAFILITPIKGREEIYNQLLAMGYDKDNIWIPQNIINGEDPSIGNYTAEQYFDKEIMRPGKNEVFIDAGSYNGANTLNFIDWCKGEYKEIYVFEPSPECMIRCKETFEKNDVKNVKLFKGGCYSSSGSLTFDNAGGMNGGAAICKGDGAKKGILIDTFTIDEVLNGKEATFIKMDIEGVELEALKGASQTIKRYKPRLAICLYHKSEDAFTIPNYIKQIREDYKFYIRKYSPHHREIVLYAV